MSVLGLADYEPWAVCAAGLTAILGHARPVWLNFSGGKSVATGLGVLLAMSWPVGLGGLAVFAVLLAIFRIVSLGSICAAVTAIILVFALGNPLPYQLLVLAGAAYVIIRHRTNITRLLAGTEPKLGKMHSPTPKA
jgi:glycerol-3-phosphate acyltransferase PlsY